MKILISDKGTIPATRYGGTQRVIWYLGKELNRMGHQVTFLVGKGSCCNFARVIELNPQVSINSQIPTDIDVVHLNYSINENLNKPYIITTHGNGSTHLLDKNTVFVSRNHAQRFGSDSYVYNGMDWSDYGTVNLTKKRVGYHFLGKAAWKVKNLKGAMTVTKALPGEYLEVLGGYRFNFKMGMRFTFSPRIHFKGMVDDVQKKQVIEQSKGLLFPVTWHEPFGLAVTESLYFGSPVFGTPYGSLPELVTSDVGFLTNNATTLINYLKDNPVYSPRICHEYACDLFNSKIMAEAYLKKYETVLNGQPLNTNAPQVTGNSRDLLWQQYTTIN